MITFTVHEPANPPADRLDRAERLVFVKDGFTYSAMAFTPIWLLMKQQWIALLLYLVVLAGLVGVQLVLESPPVWPLLASTALHVLVGYEADSIQRWRLRRKGYRMIGTVLGRNQLDCERRFLDSWLPQQPVITASAGTSAPGTLAAMANTLTLSTEPAGGPGRRWFGLLRGN